MTTPTLTGSPTARAAAPAVHERAWQATAAAVLAALAVDPAAGLSSAEAERRRPRWGANELPESAGRGAWPVLLDQLRSVMVAVLTAAAAISLALGDRLDAAAILAILALNTSLGVVQELRAERALVALRQLAAPRARVRRDGRAIEVAAAALVPGDVVLLDAGQVVPADGRLVAAASLRVQEAALTGESAPVDKRTAALPAETPLAERANLVHRGTLVVHGRGEAVVTATGRATELGRVAAMLGAIAPEPTPLQRRLAVLGRQLAAGALALVGLLVALGLARGEPLAAMVLAGLSMAVAAVPEGLPAVVTVALALGTRRMLRRRALIRRLPAVETLGSVTVVCTDKTGTLTQNRMTAECALLDGRPTALAESDRRDAHLRLLLSAAAACSDADAQTGDPTEVALVAAAEQAGVPKVDLARALPRVAELPFDPERKRMTTLHRPTAEGETLLGRAAWLREQPYLAIVKGAPDGLLPLCDRTLTAAGPIPLDDAGRERLRGAQDTLAAEGVRAIAVALRPMRAPPAPVDAALLERRLVFLGVIGLVDPLRPAAAAAVGACRAAGVRPVMVTGDHPLAAARVAREVGIAGERVVTGAELDAADDAALERLVDAVGVFARVTPAHKLRIVEALRRRGHVAAMTGDGVNDAPALKRADIGVAMGLSGTDVAREAADIVLLDDDFATIVAAVEEGRTIYDNVRRFVRYLMTSNVGELWVMLLAPLVGMPLALTPLQILWINLVTDGPPALALALEPPEPDAMRRPPRPPDEGILARGVGRQVVWVGLLMAFAALGAGGWLWAGGDAGWQTAIFTTLVVAQMANVLAARTESASLLERGLGGNPALVAAVAGTLLLQLLVVYAPAFQAVLGTRPLGPGQLAAVAVLGASVLPALEIEKWIVRRRRAAIGETPDAGSAGQTESGNGRSERCRR